MPPSIMNPFLETDRLTLRPHTVADFAESAAMWGDPAVTRYIGGRPSTREEAWARLLRYAGMWSLVGFGPWVAREKASGELVGEVGFARFERDIDPPLGAMPEIGWIFAARAHGRGLATEAARAAVAWGDTQFAGATTVCIIDPANTASIRVAEKCGYRVVRQATYKGEDTLVFER